MMKHDRKKPWRLLFCLMLPLLLTQCAPEESVVRSQSTNSGELRSRLVSLDELEKMPRFM
ncbi:hypothetical protein [Flavobacterium sp.]|uniref:hypothetical protein n=1 Tax=Flavobacterium sp. TaxID=239 RepID=UPI004033EDDF